MTVFGDQTQTILQHAAAEVEKFYIEELKRESVLHSAEMVGVTNRKAANWQKAAEMSEKSNKHLRAKVEELSEELDDTKKAKAALERKLSEAENRVRALAKRVREEAKA